jgi:anti-sigma regulatory factor (Ser/Thr protein kinase)
MTHTPPAGPTARPDSLEAARSRLALTVADYAALLAATRAAIAADAAGCPDPLVWVRALLAGRGQLPAPGISPLLVLADARTAMHMAEQPGHRAGGPERPAATARTFREHDPYRAAGAPCGCLWELSGGGRVTVARIASCGGRLHRAPQAGSATPVVVCQITLEGRPESARTARRWAARILADCPAADDAVSAVSEYVANSAVHSRSAGGGMIVARLIVAAGAWLRCEIRDAGPVRAATVHDDARPSATGSDRGEAGPLAEHGRGLELVRALAWMSGTDRAGLAWFAMHWQPGPAEPPARPAPGRAPLAVRQAVPSHA